MAAKLGKAKSQVHRDLVAGKLDPATVETTAELMRLKLALEVEERRRRVELHQIRIDQQRQKLIPAASVADIVRTIMRIVFDKLDFALESSLPQMNAGLDAAHQLANNEPVGNEIRGAVEDEVHRYLKGLEANEKKP